MAKITLTDVENLSNEQSVVSTLAQNNRLIEDAIENTLSRDGTAPNTLLEDVDVNSQRLYNLPEPTDAQDAATKNYVDSIAAADLGDITAFVAQAEAAADAAELAETNAEAAMASLEGTSTTSVTIGTGTKTFTTQADKYWTTGRFVLIQDEADLTTNWMYGQVTSYSSTTLEVDVLAVGGSGTINSWVISIAGGRGATGATGADYTADAELNALASFTATAGLMTQTSDNVFTVRTITGTTDLVTVTNGDGVSGNPTLTVGSNVVRKDSDNVLASGVQFSSTPTDLGSIGSGAAIDVTFANGPVQYCTVTAGGGHTINLPTDGYGEIFLEIVTSAATGTWGYNPVVSGTGTKVVGTPPTTTGQTLYVWIYRNNSGQHLVNWVVM
jgi:hypothetical protein